MKLEKMGLIPPPPETNQTSPLLPVDCIMYSQTQAMDYRGAVLLK